MSEPSTDDDIVTLEWHGHVAVLTLNYPRRRNAFSLKMRQSLHDRLYELSYLNDACRAIVLTGADNTFCAGGDISEMKERSVLDLRERNLLPLNVFKLLATGPTPVIAAVEGFAMGAGIALAAACDYVVTSSAARYACSFIKVGLLPDCGLYWSLAQRVGGGRARALMMTGREFNGEEAWRIGFANEKVAAGQSLTAALAVAEKYAAMPPLTMAHLKVALATGSDSLDKAIETEVNLQPLLRRSQDHQEAVKAFMEKRQPTFVGN